MKTNVNVARETPVSKSWEVLTVFFLLLFCIFQKKGEIIGEKRRVASAVLCTLMCKNQYILDSIIIKWMGDQNYKKLWILNKTMLNNPILNSLYRYFNAETSINHAWIPQIISDHKKKREKKKKERRKSISHNTETDLPGRRRHPKNSVAIGTRSNMRKLLHLNYTKPSKHADNTLNRIKN